MPMLIYYVCIVGSQKQEQKKHWKNEEVKKIKIKMST
jgi:hypothetical protein